VTASAVIANVLRDLDADFEVYLPHRETEGYGMNEKAIKYLAEKKIKLIITVDCGISNYLEIESAKKQKIDVIVTDHHCEPVKLPKAYAIINPQISSDKYPTEDLAGVGVAFKLAGAIIRKSDNEKFIEGYEKWLLDLVALGTVCDSMKLLGENRVLTNFGLVVLNKTKRPGLKALVERAGITPILEAGLLDNYTIGFLLGPRINAAGRMDHANTAYELLMAEDPDKIKDLVESIESSNQERQKITEDIVKQVIASVENIEQQQIIIAIGKGWPVGVIGLAASRVSSKFNKPVVIITELSDRLAGSGRSVEQFDMTEALVKMEDLFIKYGGHAMACGFTIKNAEALEKFKKKMNELASAKLKDIDLTPEILIESKIKLADLNWELYDQLEKFEPFGEGNQCPLFLLEQVKVNDVRTVGSDEKHLKLKLGQDGVLKTYDAIGFNFGNLIEKIKYGDLIDLVCTLDANTWNGNRELQLKIKDLKLN